MGGCCCCASRRAQHTSTPVYYYCPQTLEEREPLSSSHGVGSALSGGLLVDTNLDTSSPDTYRAPPAPMPYDSDLGRPQTPPVPQESRTIKVDETVQATDSQSTEETITEEIKEVDCKVQVAELEPLKLTEPLPIVEEEDCPICLEEYDEENPRITTKCDHFCLQTFCIHLSTSFLSMKISPSLSTSFMSMKISPSLSTSFMSMKISPRTTFKTSLPFLKNLIDVQTRRN